MFLSAPHEVEGQWLETDSHCEYTQGKPGLGQVFWSVQCSQKPGYSSRFRNWLRDGGLLVSMFGDRFSNWLKDGGILVSMFGDRFSNWLRGGGLLVHIFFEIGLATD
jgi:hypothetical protein